MNSTTILQSGWAEALLYNLGNAILITDQDLRVRYLNEAAEKLLKTTASISEGHNLNEIVQLLDSQCNTAIELHWDMVLHQRVFYHSDVGLVL